MLLQDEGRREPETVFSQEMSATLRTVLGEALGCRHPDVRPLDAVHRSIVLRRRATHGHCRTEVPFRHRVPARSIGAASPVAMTRR